MMSAGVPGTFDICLVCVRLPRASYMKEVTAPVGEVTFITRPKVSYSAVVFSFNSLLADFINPVGMYETYVRMLVGVPGLVTVVVRSLGVTEVLSVYA